MKRYHSNKMKIYYYEGVWITCINNGDLTEVITHYYTKDSLLFIIVSLSNNYKKKWLEERGSTNRKIIDWV